MPIKKRDGFIVWMYNTKYLRVLRRYGYVHYVSRRMKYAVMYWDHDATESTLGQLKKMRFVRSVEPSHLQEISTTYDKGKSEWEVKDEVLNP
ncbi:YlbG family protein [Sporolactobacillus vineae]|uniref:YlbG family protein n=1 Tax=Sporolactobacillus vineae TaxID=444463 RepID=UPI0002881F83|nr:YlbG family protein [Sporolactobacillus vineae]